jgi:hypothetical protein
MKCCLKRRCYGLSLVLLVTVSMISHAAYAETVADVVAESSVDLMPVELPPVDDFPQARLLAETESPQPVDVNGVILPPPISTSRPSFTDAATTVPQGSLQAESGVTFTDNRGGTYSWVMPETLLRFGLLHNTELRYTTPNDTYLGSNRPGRLANNWGDTSVGVSQHVRLPAEIDVTIIPILNLPTGANNVSSNALDPELRVTAARYLTKKWQVSSMISTRWTNSKNAPQTAIMTPTFINYYSFTQKITGFAEYAGFIPTAGKTTQYLQGGVLYQPTARQQWDLRMAVGLNKTSPNVLVGFGYSFRVDGLFGESRQFASF